MRSSSMTHCLQNALRKRYAWKPKNSFTQEKAQDHVLFSEQIRNVDHKIYSDNKQDHLGKHKAMHRASGKSDATLWPTEFQAYHSQQFNSRMNRDNILLPSWSRCSNHISTKNSFLKIWVRHRRSTGSVKHPSKIAARYGPDRDLRTLWEILRNFNAPIATPSRKSE